MNELLDGHCTVAQETGGEIAERGTTQMRAAIKRRGPEA